MERHLESLKCLKPFCRRFVGDLDKTAFCMRVEEIKKITNQRKEGCDAASGTTSLQSAK